LAERENANPEKGRGVLEGAFTVLDALERAEEDLGLTAVALAGGLPKATAHRILEQLRALGAVERQRGRYRIGSRMFRLGQAWQPYPRLRAAARFPVRRLTAVTRAGVLLSVLADDEVLVVDTESTLAEVVVPVKVGARFPLATAAGRALSAGMAPHVVPANYSTSGWARALDDVRRRGLALEREEVQPGVACVAAPVHAPTGHVVATISVVVDATRQFSSVAEAVQQAAKVIGAGLSHR
jgi:DNA-binding IclR family transcriptional regulator